jgi:hypothetical protein
MYGPRVREVHRAAPDDQRISDADRNDAISDLSRHTGDGRLTLEEFEERVDEVLRARTTADLRTPFRGLPAPIPTRRTMSAWRTSPRARLPANLAFVVVLVALTVVALGAWVLWIAIPMFLCRGKAHHHSYRREATSVEGETRDDELTLV